MKWSKPPRREAPHILCGEGAALGPCQNPGDATRTCPLPPPPGPATTSAGPAHPGLMAGQHTHHAAGSYSAHTRMNSSRWCGPRMDESRVRYSKLSMITATKRFSICRTGRRADSGAADSLRPPLPLQPKSARHGQGGRGHRPSQGLPGRLCLSRAVATAGLGPTLECSPQRPLPLGSTTILHLLRPAVRVRPLPLCDPSLLPSAAVTLEDEELADRRPTAALFLSVTDSGFARTVSRVRCTAQWH